LHVVFMGTPVFAVPSLRALTTEHDVLAAFTRPDAVRGRGRGTVPSPVKEDALSRGITVFETSTLRDPDVQAEISDLAPDVIVVAAYGLILPPEVLAMPRLGVLNVHASLLPRWRGAAPVARAILSGDETTGVSIMRMEEGLDTGPYSVVVEEPVGELGVDDLTSILAETGADALLETLRRVEAGTVVWTQQDESLATYANKITADELALDPTMRVDEAWRRVRVATDSAPCVVRVGGGRVRILEARPADPIDGGLPAPGAVVIGRTGPELALADGTLLLERIVPEGRRPMEASAWARGARLPDGPRWEHA
jgi:methionyl-tRNA formyltransferase